MRCRLLVVCLLASVAAPSIRAEIIDGYSPGRNDRFVSGTYPSGTPPTPNPTFFLPYDFSGVGWEPGAGPSTRSYALISPRHVIAAQHFLPGVGTTIAFRAKDGSYETRTVATQTQIGGSDVAVLGLSAALTTGPTGVATYSIGAGPNSAFLGNQIFMFGQRGRVGRNIAGQIHNAADVNVGTGPTQTVWSDYDTNLNFDGFGFAPGTPTDEFLVQGGDSGSPTFLLFGGGISLLGHHVALLNSGPTPVGNADSFLPFYSSQIAANILADGGYVLGVVAVPEPGSMVLMGLAISGLITRRLRRHG